MNDLVSKTTGTGRARRKIAPMQNAKSFPATIVAVKGAGPDPIDFSLQCVLKNDGDGYLHFDKTKNGMKKDDYYLIEFTLNDSSGFQLRFEPSPSDVFWVRMGDNVSPPKCPQDSSYSDCVYPIKIDPNGCKLTIRNDDDVVQFFRFSLGFVDKDGNSHRYDPIGSNHNGGITLE